MAIREAKPLGTVMEFNTILVLNFMLDRMDDDKPFRTLNVIDESNRDAIRIQCGTSIPSECLVRVMIDRGLWQTRSHSDGHRPRGNTSGFQRLGRA